MLCFGFSSSFTLDIPPVQLFRSCKRSDSRLLMCTTVITTMADIYAEKPETKRALSSASQQAGHTQAVISCCSLQPIWPEHPQRTRQQLRQETGNLISKINSMASRPRQHFGTLLSELPVGSGRAITLTEIELCECEINRNPCFSDKHHK